MRFRLLIPSVFVALAMAASGAAQARPNGQGLFHHDTDVCVPSVGSTDMLLTGGRSLWIGDGHYLIQSYESGDYTGFGNGAMAGLVDRGTTTCTGTLDAPVTSIDYLVK